MYSLCKIPSSQKKSSQFSDAVTLWCLASIHQSKYFSGLSTVPLTKEFSEMLLLYTIKMFLSGTWRPPPLFTPPFFCFFIPCPLFFLTTLLFSKLFYGTARGGSLHAHLKPHWSHQHHDGSKCLPAYFVQLMLVLWYFHPFRHFASVLNTLCINISYSLVDTVIWD